MKISLALDRALRSSRHLWSVPAPTLADLRDIAVRSGAVARFVEVMGGPPDFDGLDADDLHAFIRENAP